MITPEILQRTPYLPINRARCDLIIARSLLGIYFLRKTFVVPNVVVNRHPFFPESRAKSKIPLLALPFSHLD